VANQISIINPNEAAKAAQFIRLCNQEYVLANPSLLVLSNRSPHGLSRNTPIIFLHNVTGFMVGAKAEHAGIIKVGAQLVSAVSCSKVPHISVILGASYGAGNYAMCGRSYKPRFLFTWPIGKCSVMGPDQLAGVMQQIETAKTGAERLSPEAIQQRTESFKSQVQRDAESYSTSSMVIDDGIIDPRDTRDVLGMCLEVVKSAPNDTLDGHRFLARI
jgi:acetyl-CoA carboxylase carboxyltransferase component